MASRFSPNQWLTNAHAGNGRLKWILAPVAIVVAASAFLAKRARPSKSVLPSTADDALLPAGAVELSELRSEPTDLSIENDVAPAFSEQVIVDSSPADLPPAGPPEAILPLRRSGSTQLSQASVAPKPRPHKPVIIPYDPPLAGGAPPVAEISRTRRRTAPATAAALTLVAITAALAYVAFGTIHSQNAESRSDTEMLHNTQANLAAELGSSISAAPSGTVQPATASVPVQRATVAAPSTIDPLTLPATQTTEPSPPAEGVDEPPAPSPPSASNAPKAAHRHHLRSHRSTRESHKPRAFQYIPY